MLTDDDDNLPGQIITFYSYKGGTGRSMAVANLSCLLGRELAPTSRRVLIMDWDLEAPGLHRYFSARCELPQYRDQEGVANYFHTLLGRLQGSPDLYRTLTAAGGSDLLRTTMPLERYITPDVVPGVDLMRAGLFNADYGRIASGLDWVSLYNKFGGIIRTFREMLAEQYAYILIDSRTGITDVSGICTTLLPEKLVGVFVPNRQSLDGLCDIVRQAIDYRSKTNDDFRPLSVFPLPSRIENAEKDLKDVWRTTYQQTFEALFKKEYQINNCNLDNYFTEVALPHTSYYAFGR
jgi:cellulose biosynthesis protein BcsQ